ncbi:hypothetical protein ACYKAS_10780, partial [Klebsiella pneumoniae]
MTAWWTARPDRGRGGGGGGPAPPAGGGHAESPETKRRMKNLM